jgi:hypothetical protein
VARLEKLVALAAQENTTTQLSLEKLIAVINFLRATIPMSQVTRDLDLTEDDVFRIITELGTWLIHAHGAAPGEIIAADASLQLSLLPTEGAVVVPQGFDRRNGLRHDISKSIRAVLVHNPDDTELARYIDRKYPNEGLVLTDTAVHTVWTIAMVGELDNLHLGSDSPEWARVMLEAYDLIDVSLTDAHRAARRITAMQSIDLDDLANAFAQLSWLHESKMRRLTNILEIVRSSPGDDASQILERELGMLASELEKKPGWLPLNIGDLEKGQIVRLVERNGLARDPDSRKIELEIRSRLTDRGLKRDFDLLVPDGVRATLLGAPEVFWDAIEERKNGEPEWREPLDKLLESAS